MNAIDEIIGSAKAIAQGKRNVNASQKLNGFKIRLDSSDDIIILTIKDKNVSTKHGYHPEISIYLVDCEPQAYGEKLFRELVDLAARNYRSIKKELKQETIKNIRGVYEKVVGSSIAAKFGSNVEPYQEVTHFLDSLQHWGPDDLALAYRVIASQSRRTDEYEMFMDDIRLVLNFFSSYDDDFETLQFKLEEKMLLAI